MPPLSTVDARRATGVLPSGTARAPTGHTQYTTRKQARQLSAAKEADRECASGCLVGGWGAVLPLRARVWSARSKHATDTAQ